MSSIYRPDILKSQYRDSNMKLMISYSWNYKKPLVDRMYRYLVENGHDVWKDDEGGIKSNLVDDMAEAINNADFVIVCFSTPYAQGGFSWIDRPPVPGHLNLVLFSDSP